MKSGGHRRARRRRHALLLGVIYLLIAAAAGLGWLYSSLPDAIFVEQGQTVRLARLPFLEPLQDLSARNASASLRTGSYRTTLALGGVLPVKTVRTVITDRPVVTVCGTPFGIKMFSDGALVVGFTDIGTEYGLANPAKEAGLRMGDLIILADGAATHSNDELAQAISAAGGRPVQITFVRGGEQRTAVLQPVRNKQSGSWMAGMWVRDSSAGVGTLTFVEEAGGIFAGLGHSISDGDTGESIALRSGEIVPCEIVGCTCGRVGSPGELKGQFSSTHAIGTIRSNVDTGVYGTTRTAFAGEAIETAFAQEVTTGDAELLTTIDGTEPHRYSVRIEKVAYGPEAENRNLVLRVTDPELLEKTGGIVQGMSGSPILQNGRLVGAVTHVLVNDPTRGYGIFAQTMLEQAQQVAQQDAAA